MTKTDGNGLRIDVLVDTQDPDANGNGHESVRNSLGCCCLHAVALVRRRQRFQVKMLHRDRCVDELVTEAYWLVYMCGKNNGSE